MGKLKIEKANATFCPKNGILTALSISKADRDHDYMRRLKCTKEAVIFWAEKRLDRYGNPTGHYHAQPYQFHAPLQVLAYIRNHEQLEVRRMMNVVNNEKSQEE